MSSLNTYELVARSTGIDDKTFAFIDRVMSLEGLTQHTLDKIREVRGGSDIGAPEIHLDIRCAATPKIYKSIDQFVRTQLQEYPVDSIEAEKRPMYVTMSGRIISGSRKKASFRLHNHKLDVTLRKFSSGERGVSYNEGMRATYATRIFANVLFYQNTNVNYVEEQGDPVIGIKGQIDPEVKVIRMGHD